MIYVQYIIIYCQIPAPCSTLSHMLAFAPSCTSKRPLPYDASYSPLGIPCTIISNFIGSAGPTQLSMCNSQLPLSLMCEITRSQQSTLQHVMKAQSPFEECAAAGACQLSLHMMRINSSGARFHNSACVPGLLADLLLLYTPNVMIATAKPPGALLA